MIRADRQPPPNIMAKRAMATVRPRPHFRGPTNSSPLKCRDLLDAASVVPVEQQLEHRTGTARGSRSESDRVAL